LDNANGLVYYRFDESEIEESTLLLAARSRKLWQI
jgi:hypothetical protein